jgi:hypothetical protein
MVTTPGAPSAGPPSLAAVIDALKLRIRDAKRAEAVAEVRKERVAELLRNIGELWLTFGALDALMEGTIRGAVIPNWWWWTIFPVGVLLMALGTIGGEKDAAERLLREQERQ